MRSGVIVARLRKSDFGNNFPISALDEDAQNNADRAFCSVMEFVEAEPQIVNSVNIDTTYDILKVRLAEISQAYWRDWDHDERYKMVHIKNETKALVTPLRNTLARMDELTGFARTGINIKAQEFLHVDLEGTEDIYAVARAANDAIINACLAYQSEKLKKEAAIKYRNACAELVKTWTKIVERPFSKNLTMDRAVPRTRLCPPWRVFNDVDAQFVFVALYEIGRRWVRPAQVEGALRTILRK